MNHALATIALHPDKFPRDFYDWLKANWRIYEAFEREADRIRARGRLHWSQRTIWEYLRHETAMRENDCEYKMDNNMTKPCAVLYTMLHQDAGDFFHFRNGVSVAEMARAA